MHIRPPATQQSEQPTASRPRARGLEHTMKIYAGKLYDPYTLELLPRRVITTSAESGLVLDVETYDAADEASVDFADPAVVDLREATVLPGFVDAHIHLFLHAYSEVSWEDQVTKQSAPERIVRATLHARRTLMAGYTAVRDLGTEGMDDADIQLRRLMSGPSPMIPGPRYFCSNRALTTTNTYGPKNKTHFNRDGVEGVTGAEVVDGEVECIKAVRRQIGGGADWIKVYADYRPRSRMVDVSTPAAQADIATFNRRELDAIVATAHQLGVKVAAHSAHWNMNGTAIASGPGFHTVEHGYDMLFDRPDAKHLRVYRGDMPGIKTYWVPTLAAYYSMSKASPAKWEHCKRVFKHALDRGVEDIACGGDTGVFNHGENALEMKLMVQLGADWRKVLRWGTLNGWHCIRSMAWEGEEGTDRLAGVKSLSEDVRLVGDNEVPFGAVERGFAADIIATSGDLEKDFENAVDSSAILFVMKGGRVYKRDGKEVV
ncbi:uncharacterized protein C8Q71DRAFT_785711 [Rhodofomes roseus]|uniref:Amidohydrolase-related domain-containing protein n=1 Tax=Rhodofomes roseus TaxID=34475 RepID=A0ABQ8K155_9APHY|nr:uncharacterized protein C8Q71DRAFT_785711 [Rhodofomes roseus]KAH9830427.1 hypothetical protein C8Q71DRAFT_785711 [Rhodofomes roseus]